MRYILRYMEKRTTYIPGVQKQIPHLEMVKDQKRDAMDTLMRAFEQAGGDPCVQFEDDVILCNEFARKAEAAIAERPDRVINFFSRRKEDLTRGSRYQPAKQFLYMQCVYFPVGYCRQLVDYYYNGGERVAKLMQQHPTGCDIFVADFLDTREEKWFVHVPSLVQHAVVVSTINPKRSRFRQSPTFSKD